MSCRWEVLLLHQYGELFMRPEKMKVSKYNCLWLKRIDNVYFWHITAPKQVRGELIVRLLTSSADQLLGYQHCQLTNHITRGFFQSNFHTIRLHRSQKSRKQVQALLCDCNFSLPNLFLLQPKSYPQDNIKSPKPFNLSFYFRTKSNGSQCVDRAVVVNVWFVTTKNCPFYFPYISIFKSSSITLCFIKS